MTAVGWVRVIIWGYTGSVRPASVTGVSGLSPGDMPVPAPKLNMRRSEGRGTRGKHHAGPSAARAIGRLVADDPSRPRAPKHSRSGRLPGVNIGQPNPGGVHGRASDTTEPIGIGGAVTQRTLVTVHAERASPGTTTRAASHRRKGLAVVAAVVAASAGVSASLAFGLHLLPHSPRSVSVVPVDGSPAAARVGDSARAGTDGAESISASTPVWSVSCRNAAPHVDDACY